MKKTINVKSYTRHGYDVDGPIKVKAHKREINIKKASTGSNPPKIDMSNNSLNQEAIAIFYNGGYKIFPFNNNSFVTFETLKKKYGRGKIIDGQTVKQFIVYGKKEQKEYPRNGFQNKSKLNNKNIIYKNHKIITKNGLITVVSPEGNEFIPALDDSKFSGGRKIIQSANNVKTAKDYIDFKER